MPALLIYLQSNDLSRLWAAPSALAVIQKARNRNSPNAKSLAAPARFSTSPHDPSGPSPAKVAGEGLGLTKKGLEPEEAPVRGYT